MPKRFSITFLIGLSFIAFSLFSAQKPIQAQGLPTGIAIATAIEGDVKDGNIICSDKNTFILCKSEYDSSMYGVVNSSASAIFASDEPKTYPVVSTGTVKVLVSAQSGAIAAGDLITSSQNPGIGQKATRNGFVLGAATESFAPANSADTGLVTVAFNIRATTDFTDVGNNLLAIIKEGLTAPALTPLATIRYLSAGLMVIIAFALGFIYFGRIAKAGVEAIGRNPVSRNTIQIGIVLHILLTIVIIAAGLGIAYLILVL